MGQMILENMFYDPVTDGRPIDDDMSLLLVLQKVIPESLCSCKNTNTFLTVKLLLVTCHKTSRSGTRVLVNKHLPALCFWQRHVSILHGDVIITVSDGSVI